MKKTFKIFISIVVACAIYIVFSKVNAASAHLNVSSTQVEVGQTVNVSVGVNAAAWEIHVTGCVNGNYSDTSSDGNNTSFNTTPTLSFTPTTAGTYDVVLSGNVTDESSNNGQATNISDSRKITVTAVQQNTSNTSNQQTQQNQPAQQQELQFSNINSTKYTTAGINLRSQPTTSSQSYGTLEQGTEVKILAKSTSQRDGYYWYKVTANGKTGYIADMGNLTDTKNDDNEDKKEEKNGEKSTNKALKDLVVENYKLTPEFDPETTKYSVDVTKEVEELNITPILQDDKAKYEITGNENFKIGNNIVKITVTAEDGTNRIYTITVAKSNVDKALENMLKLSKLEIKDNKLSPEFKPDVTSYSILVSDPSAIKISDITALAEDEDVEVTIAEANADSNGNRVITIMLESKDGSKSGVYQVTIQKGVKDPVAELRKNQNNRVYFILGGIIGILAIAIIVVIIMLKRTSGDDDFDEVKDADELSDDYDYSAKNDMNKTNTEAAPEFDELIENSNINSQMSNKQSDDFGDTNNSNVGDETKQFNLNDEENFGDDEDFRPREKKKGKHF